MAQSAQRCEGSSDIYTTETAEIICCLTQRPHAYMRLASFLQHFPLLSGARHAQISTSVRTSTRPRTKWLRSHVVPPHHHAATLDSNGPPATKVPPRYRGLTGHVRRCLLSENMLAARPLLCSTVSACLCQTVTGCLRAIRWYTMPAQSSSSI